VDLGVLSVLTACTTTINWYLLDYDDDAFESVSINSSGVLSFTTTTAIALNTAYRFTGKVTCDDSILSQYFYVDVYVKDACFTVECTSPQVCNPCNGLCQDAPDVELF
jgi:hypothetical protein